MNTNTIGIVVENDYNDILYYDNSFIIDINSSKKDVKSTIESKLEEVLAEKAFRIETISKKIPKLELSNVDNSKENMLMYLVKVYMYSDNSDFKSREYILDNITIPSHKDYFLKYFIRYDKYNNLISPYISVFFSLFYITASLNKSLPNLLDNFWFIMLVYLVIPMTIVFKFIVPSIVNYLVKYDISEKIFKINKLAMVLTWVVYCIIVLFSFR
ncbi:hypothetical protein [Clostridium sp. CCUG 7971]|uniref:hypothetical protein n=1 Tax=Clostridium sp. CCUG 7971 TaxID=2811414 RepID=UPI001ABBC391|nr:hypothetical protein [Clostridium sp. CCUG 7971]MBO3445842.1 hypothetical protein [Clostridium sp. CCUG 7971]